MATGLGGGGGGGADSSMENNNGIVGYNQETLGSPMFGGGGAADSAALNPSPAGGIVTYGGVAAPDQPTSANIYTPPYNLPPQSAETLPEPPAGPTPCPTRRRDRAERQRSHPWAAVHGFGRADHRRRADHPADSAARSFNLPGEAESAQPLASFWTTTRIAQAGLLVWPCWPACSPSSRGGKTLERFPDQLLYQLRGIIPQRCHFREPEEFLSAFSTNYCISCGAPLVSRFLFGKERRTCPACGWIHFEDPKVAAAVLVEQDARVLLVQRVNEPGQGLWTIPAGFVDAHEDPARAAERECLEETGLVVVVTNCWGWSPVASTPTAPTWSWPTARVLLGGELKAGDDAGDAAFFHAPPCPRWPSAPRASCSASKNPSCSL